ncbi:MAG: CvpA family protein [Agathobacter sp.]|nr:CvpA family protein [Agathobacter sp.]
MNLLTIVVLAILAASTFIGLKKGFLKTAFSLVAWIIVLIVCQFATPIVTDIIIDNTDIEVAVLQTIDTKFDELMSEAMESADLQEIEATLPAGLKEALLGKDGSLQEVIENGEGIDTTALANGVIGILGFVITVILLRLAMLLVEIVLNIASKLPLIGPVDKLLGLICGLGKGIILCWVVLAAVSVLALTGVNTELATYISQSELLTWLQENNVLLNLLLSIS